MSSMRSWVQVVGVSVCSLCAVGGVAFSVQAFGLPRPTHRDLVAGAVMGDLLADRSVGGRERLNGRSADSVCMQDARPATEGVVFGRERLVGRASALARVNAPRLRLATFMAAACPVPLGEMIGNWLDRRAVAVTASRIRGVPAYELRFGWPRRRVALYVSRRSLRPLLLKVRIGRNVGSNLIASVRGRETLAETIEAVRPHA